MRKVRKAEMEGELTVWCVAKNPFNFFRLYSSFTVTYLHPVSPTMSLDVWRKLAYHIKCAATDFCLLFILVDHYKDRRVCCNEAELRLLFCVEAVGVHHAGCCSPC
jgi:hypothetical protein